MIARVLDAWWAGEIDKQGLRLFCGQVYVHTLGCRNAGRSQKLQIQSHHFGMLDRNLVQFAPPSIIFHLFFTLTVRRVDAAVTPNTHNGFTKT